MTTLSMVGNVVPGTLQTQGAFFLRPNLKENTNALAIRGHVEAWAGRYSPDARDLYALILAELRDALEHRLAAVARLVGISPAHFQQHVQGVRPMPAIALCGVGTLNQREPWEATERVQALLRRDHARRHDSFVPGDVVRVHSSFGDLLREFGAVTEFLARALDDGVIEPHEAVEFLARYRRFQEHGNALERAVIAAQVPA